MRLPEPSTAFSAADFAPRPAEWRGLARDAVRLLVARPDGVVDTVFSALGDHLRPGDLLVVNDSATIAGEVDGTRHVGGRTRRVVVHVGATLEDGTRVVELRTAPRAGRAVLGAEPGEEVRVGRGRHEATLTLLAPWPGPHPSSPTGVGNRIWQARVGGPLDTVLAGTGRPIAYGYLDRRYPLHAYQTVFARRPGSAEMASAARPFTARLLRSLAQRGVETASVTLHTGFSSQEAGEAPGPEWFEVPADTADAVNAARARGSRVVAVGTTVTRALESAVRPSQEGARAAASRGWTARVVTPDDPPRLVTGLVTGWHDPHASHLLLVEAVAGRALTQAAYDRAVAGGYLWHEFGDSALLLP